MPFAGTWMDLEIIILSKEKEKQILYANAFVGASLIAQLVKNPSATQETLVQSLGREDPLEKGQATHSSILGLPLWLSW